MDIIQDMYKEITTSVRCPAISDEFQVKIIVYQDPALSHLLFYVVMNYLTAKLQPTSPRDSSSAEDMALISESAADLDQTLEKR